jgi:uncharacterized protein (TIGR02611 family)
MIVSSEPRRPRPKLVEKLEAQRAEHLNRHPLVRFAIGVVGALVLLGGLIMLVTPGPAFVLIPIGLAILSLEFKWAEDLLETALEQAERAQQRAANTTRTQRVIGFVLTALAIAACIAAVLLWDIPLLPDN